VNGRIEIGIENSSSALHKENSMLNEKKSDRSFKVTLPSVSIHETSILIYVVHNCKHFNVLTNKDL